MFGHFEMLSLNGAKYISTSFTCPVLSSSPPLVWSPDYISSHIRLLQLNILNCSQCASLESRRSMIIIFSIIWMLLSKCVFLLFKISCKILLSFTKLKCHRTVGMTVAYQPAVQSELVDRRFSSRNTVVRLGKELQLPCPALTTSDKTTAWPFNRLCSTVLWCDGDGDLPNLEFITGNE